MARSKKPRVVALVALSLIAGVGASLLARLVTIRLLQTSSTTGYLASEPLFAGPEIVYPRVLITAPLVMRLGEGKPFVITIEKQIHFSNGPTSTEGPEYYIADRYKLNVIASDNLGFSPKELRTEQPFPRSSRSISWRWVLDPKDLGKYPVMVEGLPLSDPRVELVFVDSGTVEGVGLPLPTQPPPPDSRRVGKARIKDDVIAFDITVLDEFGLTRGRHKLVNAASVAMGVIATILTIWSTARKSATPDPAKKQPEKKERIIIPPE
jgi:hypothetical protein